MARLFCAFALTILVVESGGLATWAERLEIGALRAVALPIAAAWHRAARPFGIEVWRETAIANLEKIGWSDEPAPAAPVEEDARTVAAAPEPAAATMRTPDPPLVPNVPAHTALPPPRAAREGRPRVIALAGDSMMTVGLSAVLLRESAKRPDLHFVKAFRSGTGLARPEVFDWMRQYPAMVGAAHPDIVLVAIGANDGQGFVENGKVLAFGSEEWIAVYRRRSREFLDLLAADGAQVIWIGLPPMKKAAYSGRIDAINRIAYTVASGSERGTWWNPNPFIADADGGFREFVTAADGRSIRVRAADGIHLSDDGAALVTAQLIKGLDIPTQALGPPSPRSAEAAERGAP
jgi:hypothetical protein